jgi:electron transfer flavoprotein alpha subunit
MSKDIFVLAEHRQGRLRDVSLEMLSQATRLAGRTGGRTVCVLLGEKIDGFARTLAGYCDKVLYGESSEFADFNSDRYQRVLTGLISEGRPALVMIAHSAQGADLAPALAVAAKLSLVTNLVDIRHEGGTLRATRQFFQEKVSADYALTGEATVVVTVREGRFAIAEPIRAGGIEKLEYIEPQTGAVDIARSPILVAVGRGIKEEKNLRMIEELAAALNADICGSRVVVDAGWLPQDRQVGITGKTVRPKVYIAIGISGAFQHLAGMSGAKTIVAINKDAKAPIFAIADYAIVDDLFVVVPKLTEKIKEMRQRGR